MIILGTQALTLYRYGAGTTSSTGSYTPATPTSSTIYGSIQPLTDAETQTLTEGERQRDPRVVLTKTAVRIASSQSGLQSDEVDIDGVRYICDRVGQTRTILPYYRVICIRQPETLGG